jgi:hypothetical protein
MREGVWLQAAEYWNIEVRLHPHPRVGAGEAARRLAATLRLHRPPGMHLLGQPFQRDVAVPSFAAKLFRRDVGAWPQPCQDKVVDARFA